MNRSCARKTASVPIGKEVDIAVDGNRPMPAYRHGEGVAAYVKRLREASPMQMVDVERQGVASVFIEDLARRMELPPSRVFALLGVPAATARRKVASGAFINGQAGLAAIGIIRLIGDAQDIVDDSTSTDACRFDTVKWLGQWLERPQPALGGHAPADYLDTPTGIQIVSKLLGAISSGVYL